MGQGDLLAKTCRDASDLEDELGGIQRRVRIAPNVSATGVSQAGLEVGMGGPPAERLHEFGRIDGIPLVVSGAIGDLVEGVSR